MKTFFVGLLLGITTAVSAQSPQAQPFGKVDKADLDLTQCDFEKDANAMVLFDKGDVYFDSNFDIVMDRHKRIKIFNDKAKDEANIRIEFFGGNRLEYVTNLQAQTINLKNGQPEIIKLDKKLLYTETIDKSRTALVFSFPNVQPGSVIEYRYTWRTVALGNFPDWDFQDEIPVRYSELSTSVPEFYYYQPQMKVNGTFVRNESKSDNKSMGSGADLVSYTNNIRILGLANVRALREEPFMRSRRDNLQRVVFQLTTIRPISGFVRTYSDTWAKVGGILAEDEDFGLQLKKKLTGEEALIAKAKAMKSDEERIDFLFQTVRSSMKWNGVDRWYTNEGTPKAWETKTGNSTEVNLILYHLLKQSGIEVYPMIVSTREHGRVNPVFPFLYQFNKTVAYIPVDTAKFYVLDATNKYQGYREIPDDLLNSAGLYIDKEKKQFDMVTLMNKAPARKTVFVQAAVSPDGKLTGSLQTSSYSYHRLSDLSDYKTLGEEKYKLRLTHNDNAMKLVSLKVENAEADSLPFVQTAEFTNTLNADGDYIYFSPAVFSPVHSNPFISEERLSDIDFSHNNYYSITGSYKLPAGYKVEALPKSVSMAMPDQGILFKRLVSEVDGVVSVRFTIDHKKNFYFKESYAELRDFYKKLIEMLNEQIVLKKG